MIREWSFPAAADSVAKARQFVAEALAGLPAEGLEQVALMVSELTSNAVLHAMSEFVVTVERQDGMVRVSVSDAGSGTPMLRQPSSEQLHGRGLQIVAALASSWGVSGSEKVGKTVWFSLEG